MKKGNGTTISRQKYACLINKGILIDEELKTLRQENDDLTSNNNNKKELLRRLQEEIALMNSKVEREKINLANKVHKLEDIRSKKNKLKMKRVKKVDEIFMMKESIDQNANSIKKESGRLSKFTKSFADAKSDILVLKKNISTIRDGLPLEVADLGCKMDDMLRFLCKMLQNSREKMLQFTGGVDRMYKEFESSANSWNMSCIRITEELQKLLNVTITANDSLKLNMCSRLSPISTMQDGVVKRLAENKAEVIEGNASFIHKMQSTIENSLRYLSDTLRLITSIQEKTQEQLKVMECAVSSHASAQSEVFSGISTYMSCVHQTFSDQVQISVKMISDVNQQHEQTQMKVNAEFVKINEALVSLKELFKQQGKSSGANWNDRYDNFEVLKKVCEDLNIQFRQCVSEEPKCLEKLKSQCLSHSNRFQTDLSDQINQISTLREQLKETFREETDILNKCSHETQKRHHNRKNYIETAVSEGQEIIASSVDEARSSFQDLMPTTEEFKSKYSTDNNQILSPVNDNTFLTKGYINENISKLDEALQKEIFQQVLEIDVNSTCDTTGESENVDFNNEEVRCSTPSSHSKRRSSIPNQKLKFVEKLKEMATKKTAEHQNLTLLDGKVATNETTFVKNPLLEVKVDSNTKRSFIRRKNTK